MTLACVRSIVSFLTLVIVRLGGHRLPAPRRIWGALFVIGRGVLNDIEVHLLADLAELAAAMSIAGANVLARKSGYLAPIVLAAGSQGAAVMMLIPPRTRAIDTVAGALRLQARMFRMPVRPTTMR